jgi:hypothetical protein
VSLVRLLSIWRYRTGQTFILRSGQDFAGLIQLTTSRAQPKLRVQKQATGRFQSESKPTRLPANHAVPADALARQSVTEPYEIKAGDLTLDIQRIYPSGDGHVLCGKVVRGGPFDRAAANHSRKAARRFLLAAGFVLLGLTLFQPRVLTAAQWLLDVLYLS